MAKPAAYRLTRSLLLLATATLLPLSAFAQGPDAFDPASARLRLSEISTQLDLDEIDAQTLVALRPEIVAIEAAGDSCAASATTERARLEILFEPLRDVDAEAISPTAFERRQELLGSLDRVIQEQTVCAGIGDDAGTMLARISQLQSNLSQRYLGLRVDTIIGALRALPGQMASWPEKARGTVKLQLIEGMTPIDLLWILVVMGLIAAIAGIAIRRQFSAWFQAACESDTPPQMKHLFPKPMAEYAPLLLEGVTLLALLWLAVQNASFDLAVIRLAAAILLFGIGCVFIDWATGPLSPSATIKGLIPDHVRPLRLRLRVFLLAAVTSFVFLGTNWLAIRLVDPNVGGRATMLFLVALALFAVIQYLGNISGIQGRLRLVRYGAMSVLSVGIILLLIGFQNLAGYLIHGVTRTAIALFMLWVFLWSVFTAFQYLTSKDSEAAIQMRASLGITESASRTGLGFMQLIADLIIWICFLVYIIYVWDESGTTLGNLYERAIVGVKIGGMTIVPTDIIRSILIFAGILILVGWLKRWIDRRWLQPMHMERGAREAMITLFGYVGFVVAVLVALAQTGIDLLGLTVVSGALALGIGFGMQEIANNFVSGIILLFERPIRTGDFVTVGEVEGFVRSIRIRATEIETMDNQNVLVPNSELVSGHVTNWVLRDTAGRLRLRVGVAYGSDVEKVREILETSAADHAEVITDGSAPAPRALFMGFGDSSLDFELRARVYRIDRRFSVTSDLNFTIDDAFRRENVTIPFPQRDLHLISLPERADQQPVTETVDVDHDKEDLTATRVGLSPDTVTRSMTHEAEIATSAQEIWKALTDVELLKEWFIVEGEIDARIGGRYAYTFQDGVEAAGHIDVYVPNRRIRFVAAGRPGQEPLATGPITVEYRLREDGDTTHLTIVSSGFPATEDWQEDYNRSEKWFSEGLIELEALLRAK